MSSHGTTRHKTFLLQQSISSLITIRNTPSQRTLHIPPHHYKLTTPGISFVIIYPPSSSPVRTTRIATALQEIHPRPTISYIMFTSTLGFLPKKSPPGSPPVASCRARSSSHFFRHVEFPKWYVPPLLAMYSATCFHGILAVSKFTPVKGTRDPGPWRLKGPVAGRARLRTAISRR